MGSATFRYKRHARLLRWGRWLDFLFAFSAILLSFLISTPAIAQPIGYQEYYVLGYEEHVWRAFVNVYDGPDGDISSKICSTVSIVATANYQMVYYDHWEDGYETDPLSPVQSTTEVYGDADLSNGGTGSDILLAGNEVSLTSDENNDTIKGYVPVNRRDPDQIRYDGGDRVVSSSGPVNLTHAMWPFNTSWIGGAWEVYSRQAYADTYSYRLPVGEDLYTFGGGDDGAYGDFRDVYLQLGAFEDNTTVSIDNGIEVVNVTLDRGQTYSSMGYIGSTTAPSISIDSGTAIRSNKPTQVGLITGARSPRHTFQGRFLLILPDRLWGGDYVVPVPSGDPGDEAEVYLFNPNDFPITIHAYDRTAETTFAISSAAHISATVPYSQKRGGRVPADSAARFTSSDGTFGVVVCADTSDMAYAWGFSAIPSQELTQEYYVGWAPGSFNTPPTENGSPMWVTSLSDDTAFYVDFSPLDGVVDRQFTLDVLEQQRVFDPDNDNTGMHVWATGEFAIVWGEDPRTAGLRSPYLDLGLATLPLFQRWLDPVMTLDKTVSPTILPPAGGAATFTLLAQAYDAPLSDVDITDTLPLRWAYVPGSASVIFPDGSTGDPEPTIDDRALSWNLSANLGLNQSLTLTFQAQITDTAGIVVSTNRGEVTGRHRYTDVPFNSSDEANIYISPLNLTKSVSSAQARAGDALVYTLSYANLGESTVTNAVLRDVVPIQHVAFQSASHGGAYEPASGTVNWTLGTLAPGASGSVSFTVTVNDFVKDGTVIENVGYISSAQTAKAGSNVVRTTVLAPEVEFTKLGPTVAAQGQVVTYTLSYENVGGAQASGVTIQDTIPASTTYVAGSLAIDTGSGWVALTDAADDDQGAYIPPILTVAPGATPGTIAAGEAGQIRFSVRLDDDLPLGSLIQNWATLNRDLDIPCESNMVVTRISDLLIRKAAEQVYVAPGDVISYILTYENVSTSASQTEIYVREPVPAHTRLISGTLYGGDRIEYSWDHGAHWSATLPITPVTHIRWYDAEMLPRTQATVGFAVRVATSLPSDATIRNIAHITSTQTAAHFREWIPSNQVEVATTARDFATIYGTVFEDTDGDGMRDADESGIPRVLITLDGVTTTTTDLNGSYAFSTTVPGVHTVVETDPTYSPTAFKGRSVDSGDAPHGSDFSPSIEGKLDPSGYFSTTPNEVHVSVTLGGSYRVDFGDMLTDSGFASIHGIVFNDADGDGVRDAGEVGIPGVPVTLDGAATTTTDVNGSYTFSTTVAGIHTVVETDLAGYFSTTPNEVHVDVILGRGYRVEFGDALSSSSFATIYGTVFEDADGDGVRDVDELGIPDVLITLDWIVTATTDVNGSYTFSTPTAGTHTIVETDPGDHVSITPNTVHVDAVLGRSYRVDFGDKSLVDGTCDPDIYEEDDTAAQAAMFAVSTSQAHQFCDDATDWVKFSARADEVYTITTSSWGQRADTYLALFDLDSRRLLAANDDYGGATDYSSRIVWQAPGDGLYYVRTTNRGGMTGDLTDYDLLIEGSRSSFIYYLPIVVRNSGMGESGAGISRTASSAVLYPTGVISHACPDDYEPDDTWQQVTTTTIRVGVVQVHSFDSDPQRYAADKDFARFDAPIGKAVVFAIAPVTNTETVMELYDQRGASLSVTGTTRLMWIPRTGGHYYLSVSPQAGVSSFGCADEVGYNLLMEALEVSSIYLPLVTRES